MASFQDLAQGNYYIIQENENGSLDLVFIPMITGKCILIEFQDDEQTGVWRRLTDPVHEVVEQLSLEQAIQFENYKTGHDLGGDGEGPDWLEDDEDDEDDPDMWDDEGPNDLDFLSKN